MPTISATENPALVNQYIQAAMEPHRDASDGIIPPEPVVYQLCGGYLAPDGSWHTEFEVRELTGRDEEYLGRLANPMRVLVAILERALVRVGPYPSSPALVDALLAGDWETVYLAIRAATFGRSAEAKTTCRACQENYAVDIDLIEQIQRNEVAREDTRFEVTGRHGTVYALTLPLGATQRAMMERGEGLTSGEGNTILLADCVETINGIPPLGPDSVRDIPLADRREIVKQIDARPVGPDLRGVRTKCPFCGAEQDSPLSIAALFQV